MDFCLHLWHFKSLLIISIPLAITILLLQSTCSFWGTCFTLAPGDNWSHYTTERLWSRHANVQKSVWTSEPRMRCTCTLQSWHIDILICRLLKTNMYLVIAIQLVESLHLEHIAFNCQKRDVGVLHDAGGEDGDLQTVLLQTEHLQSRTISDLLRYSRDLKEKKLRHIHFCIGWWDTYYSV